MRSSRQFSISQSSESGIGIEIRGEFVHEGFHYGMPMVVEAEAMHVFDGLLLRPVIFSGAKGREHDPGVIVAELSVDKYLLTKSVTEMSQELNDPFIGERRPATHENHGEAETEGFGLLALGCEFATRARQFDNGGDTLLLVMGEPLPRMLHAAKEEVVYFASVRNSDENHFFAGAARRAETCDDAAAKK
jgi:hypothetical protein